MPYNPFDRGEFSGDRSGYTDRFEEAVKKGYRVNKKSIVDIDGLPTATQITGRSKPVDNILYPDDNTPAFTQYKEGITPEAIDYFKNNPAVTSVDFAISYPGYTNFDYNPLSTSDLSKGFVSNNEGFNKRSAIFATSLKDRVKKVNEVFDANPQFNDKTVDTATYWPGGDDIDSSPEIRRISMTSDDIKNLSSSLNNF